MSKSDEIPNWGLYMMLIASAIGTVLLFRQLIQKGFPKPWLQRKRGVYSYSSDQSNRPNAANQGIMKGGHYLIQ